MLLEASAQAVCGNGSTDSGETCDDGNNSSNDGCDSACQTETGWQCTPAVFELDFAETHTGDNHSGNPSWTLSADGRTVSQSINSRPGIYVSTLPATGVTATFTLQVNTSSDDDWVGWAVGYEAGDFTNPNAEWILFD